MMENSSIVLLVISLVISFTIGRIFKRSRDKKHEIARQLQAEKAFRDRPAEPESKNKSKRKRQLQQLQQQGRKGG